MSCGSAGNCSVGGDYEDSSGGFQAWVVSQVQGSWGTAIEVPGTAALNQGRSAEVDSVSCASAGNCSAGGYYTDSSGHQQALVVSQVQGRWGTAIEVPGTAALNRGGSAEVDSVSCRSAGNCSAAGSYQDGTGHTQVFVVSQVQGRWGTATEVPGAAALNRKGDAGITSVSCGSAGNCGAGGFYEDSAGGFQAFVVSQVQGRWGTAIEVPGTAALNKKGDAGITSVSCASAGNCSAGGSYIGSLYRQQVFVISQVQGRWGTAIEVPGTAALNGGGGAEIFSVSCASAGNCSVGGHYEDSSDSFQAFAVSQVQGRWGTAIEVPGTAALNQGGDAGITSVSCGSAGNCGAGGSYTDSSGHSHAFVVSQVQGRWSVAIEVPGTAALNRGGGAGTTSVSCASAGECSATGHYIDGSSAHQAFVVSQT